MEILREHSKEIANEILKRKEGVFIIVGVRESGKTTILAELLKYEKEPLFLNAEIVVRHGEQLLDLLHYAYAKGAPLILD